MSKRGELFIRFQENHNKISQKLTLLSERLDSLDIKIKSLPDKSKRYKLTNRIRRIQKTYLLKDKNTGFYKIGKSVNPKNREKTLQAEKPTYKLIKTWDEDIEKELHNKYASQRVRGEWFELTKIQIKYICTHY